MARPSPAHEAAEPAVPPQLLAERRAGWRFFTRSIEANIVAVAALLLFLLLVFKVL